MTAAPMSSRYGRGLCLAALPGVSPDPLFPGPLSHHQNILRCSPAAGSWVQIAVPWQDGRS